MKNVYQSIEDHNPGKKRKVLLVFHDMVGDVTPNKKLHPVTTELFIRSQKLIISLVFITQSFFHTPKSVTLNTTHFIIMKIPNRQKLLEIAINHLSDTEFGEFKRLVRKCTAESHSFFITDITLQSENALRFQKNLLEEV